MLTYMYAPVGIGNAADQYHHHINTPLDSFNGHFPGEPGSAGASQLLTSCSTLSITWAFSQAKPKLSISSLTLVSHMGVFHYYEQLTGSCIWLTQLLMTDWACKCHSIILTKMFTTNKFMVIVTPNSCSFNIIQDQNRKPEGKLYICSDI